MLAAVPEADKKAVIFTNAANDAASCVARGLDKAAAVDELHDIAFAYGLVEARGEDMIQTTIADAFMRADRAPDWGSFDVPARAPGGNGQGHPGAAQLPPLPPIMSKAAFLACYGKPADFLIDDMLIKGYIYALTGQTGHAKTAVALLLARLVASSDQNASLGVRKIAKGRVVYFVGENPDDVSMRIKGSDAVRRDIAEDDDIAFVPGIFDIERMMAALDADTKAHGKISLVIVDTSAAYFLGNEELSNTQMGSYARVLRKLTTLPGHPCVLVLCHPIKHVIEPSQLLPRGGSAYLNEMDGNLTLWRIADDMVQLDHTKLRGTTPFQPISFQLKPIKTPTLVDAKGRQISTIEAVMVSTKEEEAAQDRDTEDENRVITAMLKLPEGSLADWAEHLHWSDGNNAPYRMRVQRIINRLDKEKPRLVKKQRKQWVLTDEGKEQARKAALEFEAKARANAQPKML